MTSDERARVLARRRRTVDAQNATIAQATRAHSDLAAGAHLPHPIGARVFDTVAGQHGIVVGGAPASAARGPRVEVRMPSGAIVARHPQVLIARPSPPPRRS